MFFSKSDIYKKQKNPPAGMLATEVRSGDAPKPYFSMETDEQIKNPEISPRSTIEICLYFWVCGMYIDSFEV